MSSIPNTAIAVDPPKRTQVEVSGTAQIRRFLETAYGTRLRLQEKRPGSPVDRLTHGRIDIGRALIDDVWLPGDAEFSPDPVEKVVVAWLTEGRLEGHCAGTAAKAGPGDVTMLAQPDLPHYAHSEDLCVTTVLLEPSFVAGVASGLPSDQAGLPLRFADFSPVDTRSSELWRSTVTYVKTCLLDADAVTPLVVAEANRLLAVALLTAFPISLGHSGTSHDRTDASSTMLRRALEYMDGNVRNDIALADIAGAVHVTPRAVQLMFRRHLDVTPLQYLRELRLRHARHDLVVGDRHSETVARVAARWGFPHTGRFAVFYRETYGESPHETLRR